MDEYYIAEDLDTRLFEIWTQSGACCGRYGTWHDAAVALEELEASDE